MFAGPAQTTIRLVVKVDYLCRRQKRMQLFNRRQVDSTGSLEVARRVDYASRTQEQVASRLMAAQPSSGNALGSECFGEERGLATLLKDRRGTERRSIAFAVAALGQKEACSSFVNLGYAAAVLEVDEDGAGLIEMFERLCK